MRGSAVDTSILADTVFQPFAFLASWRSLPRYELASYPLMFASVPMLAHASKPYDAALLTVIVLTVLSLYAGFFAALIVNDITDSDIDAIAHPDRPLPAGRVSAKGFMITATIFTMICFGVAALISAWCLLLVATTMAFVIVHDKYLKRSIRLPAYSELFGSMQWIAVALFGYVAVWSRTPLHSSLSISWPVVGSLSTSSPELANMLLLAAFIYFADTWHDIPEGIHDAVGDRKAGVRTFAVSFGEANAARCAFGIFVASGAVGVMLYLKTSLSLLYLLTFLGLFIFTARHPIRLMRMKDVALMRAAGPEVGRRGFDYFLFSFVLMFVDLLVQQLAARA